MTKNSHPNGWELKTKKDISLLIFYGKHTEDVAAKLPRVSHDSHIIYLRGLGRLVMVMVFMEDFQSTPVFIPETVI